MSDGIVIDRKRLTHEQAVRATINQIESLRAQRDLDAEKLRQVFAETDEIIRQVVVALPEGWLPEGVSLNDPDWTRHIAQEHYEAITEAMQPPAKAGEKKA